MKLNNIRRSAFHSAYELPYFLEKNSLICALPTTVSKLVRNLPELCRINGKSLCQIHMRPEKPVAEKFGTSLALGFDRSLRGNLDLAFTLWNGNLILLVEGLSRFNFDDYIFIKKLLAQGVKNGISVVLVEKNFSMLFNPNIFNSAIRAGFSFSVVSTENRARTRFFFVVRLLIWVCNVCIF